MAEQSPATPLSEAQTQRLDAGDASLQRLLYNWAQTGEAADKLTVGDMKKLTMLLRQFTRALNIEHYSHGLRDGAETAKKELGRIEGELRATQAERQRAQESCEQMGMRLRSEEVPPIPDYDKAVRIVKDANRNARKGRRE